DQNRLERTPGGSVQMGLIGVRVFRYRITDGRTVPQAIQELQNDNRVVSIQPNYIYQLSDMRMRRPVVVAQVRPAARTASGGMTQGRAPAAPQYVVAKLRLIEAHRVSRGE